MSDSELLEKARKSSLLVVPTYNNRASILSVLKTCLKFHSHILVVDDGSCDGSEDMIAQFSEEHEIARIRLEENSGKGKAILAAFRYAKAKDFSYIITCDADGQHDPEDVLKFIDKISHSPKSVFVGARDMESSLAGDVPNSSKFGKAFSNFWLFVETGLFLQDTQSGFRAYPVEESIYESIKASHYDSEIELLVKFAWAGVPIVDLDINVSYPKREERVSHFRPFVDNARLTLLHTILVTFNVLRFLKLYRPQKISSLNKSKERGGSFMMPLLLKLFGKSFAFLLMPFPLLFFFLSSKKARNGIALLYQNMGKPKREILCHSFKNYWYFACSLLDRLTLPSVEVSCRYTINPGSIYIGAHYGDWLISAVRLSSKERMTVGIIMDPSQTPDFHERLKKINLAQVQIVDARKSAVELALAIKDILDQKGVICFLGDRVSLPKNSRKVEFLGKEAYFPEGPFQIASVLRVPTYFFYARRQSMFAKASYELVCETVWDGKTKTKPDKILNSYVSLLENQIKEHPQHWFNFYNFWAEYHG